MLHTHYFNGVSENDCAKNFYFFNYVDEESSAQRSSLTCLEQHRIEKELKYSDTDFDCPSIS